MLWSIIILLVILWAIGLFAHLVGGLIHILLVIAVILLAIKLLKRIF